MHPKRPKNKYDLRNRPISELTDSEIRGRIATMSKRQLELQAEIDKIDDMRIALHSELKGRK